MRVLLMHNNQDFDLQRQLPSNEQELSQDLELNTLFGAMALDDTFVYDVAKQAVLAGEADLDTIRYRQDILKDCLANPAIAREIYQIAVDTTKNKREYRLGIFTNYPNDVLNSSIKMMRMFMGLLRQLKGLADEHGPKFQSAGFITFFTTIKQELDDAYFANAENHLRELAFSNGIVISAGLGKGNEGADYMLCKPRARDFKADIKGFLTGEKPGYTFSIPPRDDHGARALGELRDQGIYLVATALSRSTDHIDSFFQQLRIELAFYLGCLNLAEQLGSMGNPICIPVPTAASERRHTFVGLYDASLALTIKQKVIGNSVNADGKDLVIITGANQGGKSTFLRSIGLAQLLMHCGMFVPAESFSANLCEGLFTHYRRQEDASMKSGKLDEELARMNTIVEHLASNAMVLFNESFAATNEREGSEIARQITSALVEKHIKVFFVTHQYEFAHGFYEKDLENAVFLQAERTMDGGRTFQLTEGEPLPTSYGKDIYLAVFGGEG